MPNTRAPSFFRVLFSDFTLPRCPRQEGEAIIAQFVEKARTLEASGLSEDALRAELEKLKREVDEKKNPYVEDVLARGT